MSKQYIIDSYAWVEYLDGSKRGEKLRTILDDAETTTYTSAVTLAEVVSKAIRTHRDHELALKVLSSDSTIVDADEELSKSAGIIHAQARQTSSDFGLADAYVLATARKLEGKIVTGDPHFQGYKEAIMI